MLRLITITLMSLTSIFASSSLTFNDPIYGTAMIEGIPHYHKFGETFTYLQSEWFSIGFLIALLFVPIAGGIHYLLIGPKIFSHEGRKIYAFNLFMRVIHLLAAVSFIVLVPTGFIMAFGDFFGGGVFVRTCKNLHGLATILFSIAVLPILIVWIKDMFPSKDDIKWMIIVGGYLSKEKKPVPSGKFNAGQKSWFWIGIFGGLVMIFTGAMMFFLANPTITPVANLFGITQIDLLRICAITHNILGMLIAAFFMVHIYMSVFAIKGSINSMINGYKEEEEVKILHSSWYKKLKTEGKV